MEDKIKQIAVFNGYAYRFNKATEELLELANAITHDDLKGIIEELADVEVILAEVKYLYDIAEEVELCKQYKVDRQLLRIKKAKEHEKAVADEMTKERLVYVEDN